MNFAMKKTAAMAAVLATIGNLFAFAPMATADSSVPQNAEFRLIEGLIAASGVDLSTKKGQELYQEQVKTLLTAYDANHTVDGSQALENMHEAFQVMGMSDRVLAPIQELRARYTAIAQANPTMTQAEAQQLMQRFEKDLFTKLQALPAPQGAQFSACQWSVVLTLGGLAIGVPALAYTAGRAMGDQDTSKWISGPGAIAFLLGIGGLIALGPTCL